MNSDEATIPNKPLRKPEWLKIRLEHNADFGRMSGIISSKKLHTVCQEALCPNICQCWGSSRVTIMILGGICTRGCSFCGVEPGSPVVCDTDEPERVAEAIKSIGLNEVVITSVTRDDLPDGGSGIWAKTISLVRKAMPKMMIEVLIPDFAGNKQAIEHVLEARPDVLGHNLETVQRLYPELRKKADYKRSLALLKKAKQSGLITKTAIMLGVGEEREEIVQLMDDARSVDCDILFIGQYLQPGKKHFPVLRYVEPSEFTELGRIAESKGFGIVESAPLVRSSFYSKKQSEFVRQQNPG